MGSWSDDGLWCGGSWWDRDREVACGGLRVSSRLVQTLFPSDFPACVGAWRGLAIGRRGGASSAASQTGGKRKGLGLGPGGSGGVKAVLARAAALGLSVGCPEHSVGSSRVPTSPGLVFMALGWVWWLLGRWNVTHGSRASWLTQGQAVPSHCGVSLASVDAAAGEHPGLILGL